jgi:integrase/recombinase XerD
MIMKVERTPVRKKAEYFCKHLKKENPDYNYLRELFRHIRKNLNIEMDSAKEKRLPYVPTEEEVNRYYQTVWKSRNMQHVVMIKTLLYTGVRVSELVNIRISDIDLDNCQIKVVQGKGKKDRIVPFPNSFKEILAVHIENIKKNNAKYLFESSWKKPYSDRGIRKILMGSSGRTPKSVVLFFYSHQSQCFSTLPQLILSQPLLKLPIFTFLALKYLYKVVFEIPN